jgi:hypothetical protein
VNGHGRMPAYRPDQTIPTLPLKRRSHRGPRRFAKARRVIFSPAFVAAAGLSCIAVGATLMLQLSLAVPASDPSPLPPSPVVGVETPPTSSMTSSVAPSPSDVSFSSCVTSTQTQPTSVETAGFAANAPARASTVTTTPARLGTSQTPSASPSSAPAPELSPSPSVSLTTQPLPEGDYISPLAGMGSVVPATDAPTGG